MTFVQFLRTEFQQTAKESRGSFVLMVLCWSVVLPLAFALWLIAGDEEE